MIKTNPNIFYSPAGPRLDVGVKTAGDCKTATTSV